MEIILHPIKLDGLIDTNPALQSPTHPQHLSFELYSKYRNTLFYVIYENENLHTEMNHMLGELQSQWQKH